MRSTGTGSGRKREEAEDDEHGPARLLKGEFVTLIARGVALM
jgi:hypothetical protein